MLLIEHLEMLHFLLAHSMKYELLGRVHKDEKWRV
jgi:hypothetical protein